MRFVISSIFFGVFRVWRIISEEGTMSAAVVFVFAIPQRACTFIIAAATIPAAICATIGSNSSNSSRRSGQRQASLGTPIILHPLFSLLLVFFLESQRTRQMIHPTSFGGDRHGQFFGVRPRLSSAAAAPLGFVGIAATTEGGGSEDLLDGGAEGGRLGIVIIIIVVFVVVVVVVWIVVLRLLLDIFLLPFVIVLLF